MQVSPLHLLSNSPKPLFFLQNVNPLTASHRTRTLYWYKYTVKLFKSDTSINWTPEKRTLVGTIQFQTLSLCKKCLSISDSFLVGQLLFLKTILLVLLPTVLPLNLPPGNVTSSSCQCAICSTSLKFVLSLDNINMHGPVFEQ